MQPNFERICGALRALIGHLDAMAQPGFDFSRATPMEADIFGADGDDCQQISRDLLSLIAALNQGAVHLFDIDHETVKLLQEAWGEVTRAKAHHWPAVPTGSPRSPDELRKDAADRAERLRRIEVGLQAERSAARAGSGAAARATSQPDKSPPAPSKAPACLHGSAKPIDASQTDNSESTSSNPAAGKKKRRTRQEWVAQALIMLRENPNMSNVELARRVGIHPGALAGNRRPVELKALDEILKERRPTGHIEVSNTGQPTIEAMAPDQRTPIPGTPIEGSRYFVEYCHRCGDQIRVTKETVGTRVVCDDCKA